MPDQQPVPDEAVQTLTRFLQAEWAGPYMARASNFTREEVLAGALAAADAEAHGEAEAVARRGLEDAAPFIRAQVIRELRDAASDQGPQSAYWLAADLLERK